MSRIELHLSGPCDFSVMALQCAEELLVDHGDEPLIALVPTLAEAAYHGREIPTFIPIRCDRRLDGDAWSVLGWDHQVWSPGV